MSKLNKYYNIFNNFLNKASSKFTNQLKPINANKIKFVNRIKTINVYKTLKKNEKIIISETYKKVIKTKYSFKNKFLQPKILISKILGKEYFKPKKLFVKNLTKIQVFFRNALINKKFTKESSDIIKGSIKKILNLINVFSIRSDNYVQRKISSNLLNKIKTHYVADYIYLLTNNLNLRFFEKISAYTIWKLIINKMSVNKYKYESSALKGQLNFLSIFYKHSRIENAIKLSKKMSLKNNYIGNKILKDNQKKSKNLPSTLLVKEELIPAKLKYTFNRDDLKNNYNIHKLFSLEKTIYQKANTKLYKIGFIKKNKKLQYTIIKHLFKKKLIVNSKLNMKNEIKYQTYMINEFSFNSTFNKLYIINKSINTLFLFESMYSYKKLQSMIKYKKLKEVLFKTRFFSRYYNVKANTNYHNILTGLNITLNNITFKSLYINLHFYYNINEKNTLLFSNNKKYNWLYFFRLKNIFFNNIANDIYLKNNKKNKITLFFIKNYFLNLSSIFNIKMPKLLFNYSNFSISNFFNVSIYLLKKNITLKNLLFILDVSLTRKNYILKNIYPYKAYNKHIFSGYNDILQFEQKIPSSNIVYKKFIKKLNLVIITKYLTYFYNFFFKLIFIPNICLEYIVKSIYFFFLKIKINKFVIYQNYYTSFFFKNIIKTVSLLITKTKYLVIKIKFILNKLTKSLFKIKFNNLMLIICLVMLTNYTYWFELYDIKIILITIFSNFSHIAFLIHSIQMKNTFGIILLVLIVSKIFLKQWRYTTEGLFEFYFITVVLIKSTQAHELSKQFRLLFGEIILNLRPKKYHYKQLPPKNTWSYENEYLNRLLDYYYDIYKEHLFLSVYLFALILILFPLISFEVPFFSKKNNNSTNLNMNFSFFFNNSISIKYYIQNIVLNINTEIIRLKKKLFYETIFFSNNMFWIPQIGWVKVNNSKNYIFNNNSMFNIIIYNNKNYITTKSLIEEFLFQTNSKNNFLFYFFLPTNTFLKNISNNYSKALNKSFYFNNLSFISYKLPNNLSSNWIPKIIKNSSSLNTFNTKNLDMQVELLFQTDILLYYSNYLKFKNLVSKLNVRDTFYYVYWNNFNNKFLHRSNYLEKLNLTKKTLGVGVFPIQDLQTIIYSNLWTQTYENNTNIIDIFSDFSVINNTRKNYLYAVTSYHEIFNFFLNTSISLQKITPDFEYLWDLSQDSISGDLAEDYEYYFSIEYLILERFLIENLNFSKLSSINDSVNDIVIRENNYFQTFFQYLYYIQFNFNEFRPIRLEAQLNFKFVQDFPIDRLYKIRNKYLYKGLRTFQQYLIYKPDLLKNYNKNSRLNIFIKLLTKIDNLFYKKFWRNRRFLFGLKLIRDKFNIELWNAMKKDKFFGITSSLESHLVYYERKFIFLINKLFTDLPYFLRESFATTYLKNVFSFKSKNRVLDTNQVINLWDIFYFYKDPLKSFYETIPEQHIYDFLQITNDEFPDDMHIDIINSDALANNIIMDNSDNMEIETINELPKAEEMFLNLEESSDNDQELYFDFTAETNHLFFKYDTEFSYQDFEHFDNHNFFLFFELDYYCLTDVFNLEYSNTFKFNTSKINFLEQFSFYNIYYFYTIRSIIEITNIINKYMQLSNYKNITNYGIIKSQTNNLVVFKYNPFAEKLSRFYNNISFPILADSHKYNLDKELRNNSIHFFNTFRNYIELTHLQLNHLIIKLYPIINTFNIYIFFLTNFEQNKMSLLNNIKYDFFSLFANFFKLKNDLLFSLKGQISIKFNNQENYIALSDHVKYDIKDYSPKPIFFNTITVDENYFTNINLKSSMYYEKNIIESSFNDFNFPFFGSFEDKKKNQIKKSLIEELNHISSAEFILTPILINLHYNYNNLQYSTIKIVSNYIFLRMLYYINKNQNVIVNNIFIDYTELNFQDIF